MSRAHALPFDIVRLVIAACSSNRETLQALSLTCKDFWEEAIRHMWRTTRILGTTLDGTMKRAEFIVARPRCARHTKHLLVAIPPDLGPGTELPPSKYLSSTLDAMVTAMSVMHNLLSLHLLVGVGGAESVVGAALSRLVPMAPFRLQFFSTNMVITEEIASFLESQPDIRDLESRGWFSDHVLLGQSSVLSNPRVLPRLMCLRYPARGVEKVVRGKPVQKLRVMVAGDTGIQDVVFAINASAASVTTLEVNFTDCHLVYPFLKALALMRYPDRRMGVAGEGCLVETLTIWVNDHSRPYPGAFIDPDLDPAFLAFMRHGFPRLHTLSWMGNLVPPAAWKPEQYAGRALRMVKGRTNLCEFLENEGKWVAR